MRIRQFTKELIRRYKESPAGQAARRHPELALSGFIFFAVGAVLVLLVNWKIALGVFCMLWGNNINEWTKRN